MRGSYIERENTCKVEYVIGNRVYYNKQGKLSTWGYHITDQAQS
jgi:hypothetical protein